jgi:hypothetical protein
MFTSFHRHFTRSNRSKIGFKSNDEKHGLTPKGYG